jgi:integrase
MVLGAKLGAKNGLEFDGGPQMALKDLEIRRLTSRPKPYKVADALGLFLLIQPSGAKLWRFKYRFHGREGKLTFGRYPDVSLAKARERRDEARQMLANGIDPAAAKREAEAIAKISQETTFKQIAEEFIERMKVEMRSEATLTKARWFVKLLDHDIAHRPISEITPYEMLRALRKVEARGHRETAIRLRSFASRVFRYAIVTLRATANPADVLRGSLATPNVRHHAAILDPAEVGALMRAIEEYPGQRETWIALRMSAHVFARPGEIRKAEWSEILFDAAVWRIPAEKMKMRQPHAVPLSTQVVAMLRQLRSFGNPGPYLFPSIRSAKAPMSDGTLNAALRRIGYDKDEMTSHGFRAMASTLLNESGLWHPDAVERSLAHQCNDRVRAAYHRGAHWDERVRMMQWWSDQLDLYRSARNGASPLPLRSMAALGGRLPLGT